MVRPWVLGSGLSGMLLSLLTLVLLLILSIASIALNQLPFAYAQSGTEYHVGTPATLENGKSNIPKMDGIYNMTLMKAFDENGRVIWVDEWNDSVKIPLPVKSNLFPTNLTGYAYLLLKKNDTHLMFLYDFITDLTKKGTEAASDLVGFFFDTDNSGGCPTRKDYNICLETQRPFHKFLYKGVNCAWKLVSTSPAVVYSAGLGVSPNSDVPHKIVEGAIQMKYVIDPESGQNIVGFLGSVRDGDRILMRTSDIGITDLDNFDKLLFVPNVVPEFQYAGLILPASLASSLYLLRKRRRERGED